MVLFTQSIVPLLSYTLYPDVHSSLTLPLNFSHFLYIFYMYFLSTFPVISEISESFGLYLVPPSNMASFAFCILELYHDFVRFGYLSQ